MGKIKRALILGMGATAVAGGLSAGPAAATKQWADCGGPTACFYKNPNGTGSKFFITLYGFHHLSVAVSLANPPAHFIDGTLANNQISSVLNNTKCTFVLRAGEGDRNFYTVRPGTRAPDLGYMDNRTTDIKVSCP